MSYPNSISTNNQIIFKDNVMYKIWNPEHEVTDFEPMIKYHVKDIFGDKAEYFEKQKLRTLADHRSIPDGFVVDFKRKKWYIVELKLLCDDAIKRIPGQIVDYKNAIKNKSTRRKIYKAIKLIRNVDFLDDLINDEEPEIIVIIDRLEGRLGEKFIEKVKGIDSEIKIIEFKTFARDGADPRMVHLHLFEPLYSITPVTPSATFIKTTESSFRAELGSIRIQEVGTEAGHRAKKGELFPRDGYYIPILKTIIDLGGSGSSKVIIDNVGETLKSRFTDKEYETIQQGRAIRWRNRTAWARNDLVNNMGLLKKGSPHGIWEITEEGRTYYKQNITAWKKKYGKII